MSEPIQPIVPEGTPLPPAPVGVPPFPITPFAVWTWSSPVIPEFYWNVYSAEQRIKQICKEIGRIEAYLNYLVNKTNENLIEIHKRIDALTDRVAALESHVEEEVARLDALIAQLRADLEQEIADREAGDQALGERIDQEIQDRQDADNALHAEISQEVEDRIHGDETLHDEISAEATARTHADDQLHQEISTETQNRIHADDQLHEEISHRLLPTDIQAGAEIEITRPDPESNTIVIASTVAHSIAELASTVSGLQAALTAETAERRADDASLWQAVNQRIERGKILAGPGIEVENDPDASTVTISATGGSGGGATEITGIEPMEVTGDPEEGYTIGVSAATEEEAGVITEARVKELAPDITLTSSDDLLVTDRTDQALRQTIAYEEEYGSGNPTITRNIYLGPEGAYVISPGEGYVEGSGLRFTKSTSKKGFRLAVKTGTGITISGKGEVVATRATESDPGIITEARVKELAAGEAGPSLSAEAPLKLEDGQISLTKDPAGPVTSSSAGLSVREITPDTESEEETGVVSKKTIKSLVKPFDGGVDPEGGLETTIDGLLAVKLGSNTVYNDLGFGEDGELTLVGAGTTVHAASKTIAEPVGQPTPTTDWGNGFWVGRPQFIQDANQPTTQSKAEFVLSSGVFEVQEAGSTAWNKAELGTFELVSYPDRIREDGAAAGYPQYHSLYARITPYGQSYYTPSTTEEEGRVKIQGLRVKYSYYNVYVLPVAGPQ